MVNNQEWFNNEYLKEESEIKLRYKKFAGQLVIEDYSQLESLQLLKVNSISKLVLRNLAQLQDCTVQSCGVVELVIENCPHLKKLNLRTNQLTNLEFLPDLNNLEELELDHNPNLAAGLEHLPASLATFSYQNTKLTELLKPYQGDWKVWKMVQKLAEQAKKNPAELAKQLWNLQKEIQKLKEQQPITLDNPVDFEHKYQQLKKFLNLLVKGEQLKTEEIRALKTADLTTKLAEQKENLVQAEQAVEQKVKDLNELHKINHRLQSKLDFFEQLYQTTKKRVTDKKKELALLKASLLTKSSNYDQQKLEKKITKLLRFQTDIVNFNSPSLLAEKTEIKDALVKKASLTDKELEQLCSLQAEITRLELKMQKSFNSQQFPQTINNHYHVFQSIVAQSSQIGGNFNPQMDMDAREFINEIMVLTDHYHQH